MSYGDLPRKKIFEMIGRRVAAARNRDPDKPSGATLAARVGVTRASVSALEAGHQGVSVATLCGLALALDVEPAILLPTRAELKMLLTEPEEKPADLLVEEYLSRHE